MCYHFSVNNSKKGFFNMRNKKFDEYGHRIRNIEEILVIKENLKTYILTQDKEVICKYLGIWNDLKKEKGYDECTFIDMLDMLMQYECNEKYIDHSLCSIAIDIWDVLHPLSQNEAKEREILARKKLVWF